MISHIKRLLLLLVVSQTFSVNTFSQLTLEQMINVKLGETFKESKQNVTSMFSIKASISKGDFFGASIIEFANLPFDYYGNGNYTFQYLKERLTSVSVEFQFLAQDTLKFARLLNTFINEFNNDKSKKIYKKDTDLNVSNVLKYVNKECIRTTNKMDKDYKSINTKYLGERIWFLYNNATYTGKYIRLTVDLGEKHNSGALGTYDGGCVNVVIQIMDDKLQDLEVQASKLSTLSYRSINSEEEQINLKFQNGVYQVPVKLNSTLTMDFVLDLGASDVSISPDIFLVLYRAGTITESDFIGSQTYQFADGTSAKSNVFNIKSIQIGNKEIKNVRASISNSLNAPLLLGQSALKKLDGYRIDNNQKLLIID